MTISIEDKKKEAVERMKLLNIYPETIRQFENDGYISESLPPVGACYWVEGEQLDRVREFEKKNNAIVYHVIHAKYNLGGDLFDMESYLFVGDHIEEWDLDRDDIANGQTFAFVQNNTAPDLSEFGAIGVETTPAGGLRRTW